MDDVNVARAAIEGVTADGRWKLFSKAENGREVRTLEHSSRVFDAKFSTVILDPSGEVIDVDDWETKEEARLGHDLMLAKATVLP